MSTAAIAPGTARVRALGLALLVATAIGGLPAAGATDDDSSDVDVGTADGMVLLPRGHPYPLYLADPRQPGFAVARLAVQDASVADVGDSRLELKMGASLGLVGWRSGARPKRGWQLDLLVGFIGQFDVENSYDNVGWDGNYGLKFTYALGPRLAFKTGIFHTSAHVGDELIERTGRTRIGYTREELFVGVSWSPRPRIRIYGEGGWGYVLRNETLQEPGRLQAGIEHRSGAFWRGRLRAYAALDAGATEERDWRVDTTLAAGVLLTAGHRRWRLGLERRDGAPPLGEFFQDTERYLTFGVWLDV